MCIYKCLPYLQVSPLLLFTDVSYTCLNKFPPYHTCLYTSLNLSYTCLYKCHPYLSTQVSSPQISKCWGQTIPPPTRQGSDLTLMNMMMRSWEMMMKLYLANSCTIIFIPALIFGEARVATQDSSSTSVVQMVGARSVTSRDVRNTALRYYTMSYHVMSCHVISC